MRTVVAAHIALVAAMAAGCSDSTHNVIPTDTGGILIGATMSPASATVHVGEVEQFNVTPGRVPYSVWLWRVNDTTVATVDSTGLVHARKNGTITVIASAAAASTDIVAGVLTVLP